MQSNTGGGCAGIPCFFGCTSVGNGGYSCGCPQGYHIVGEYCFKCLIKFCIKIPNVSISVGQGHCLSTIDGGYSTDDIGNVPIFPIDDDLQNRRNGQKIISTEGCFSCKVIK